MRIRKSILYVISIGYFIIVPSCTTKHSYPAATLTAFRTSCMTNGGTKQGCTCILDKIRETYSYEDFAEIEAQLQEGKDLSEFQTFLEKAKMNCASNP